SFLCAALYCNWLSAQEEIPPSEWCYDLVIGKRAVDTRVTSRSHDRLGYRMPTEAEWEYACRAGTETSRFFGESAEYLPKYAWMYSNSEGRTWPVGRLRPNPLGLFDVYGNVSEWCERSWNDIPLTNEILRGGSWRQPDAAHRSDGRAEATTFFFNDTIGF